MKIARVVRNIVTCDEASRRYPDKALELLWDTFGRPAQTRRPVAAVGAELYRRACRTQDHEAFSDYTRFMPNPPQLEVLRDAALEKDRCATLTTTVVGCSSGAELYSAVWTIRTARPDLKVLAVGVDISEACIQRAVAATYRLGTKIVEGMNETSYQGLFDRQGDMLRVQDWLRADVRWKVADARSGTLRNELGLQDVVLANNCLCHMSDEDAETWLRNIAELVAPNGYLFVWGINLDVRTRVVRALGLIPVTARLEEIYMADRGAREAWPLKYWGIEPMDKGRSDWTLRYATVFRHPGGMSRASAGRLGHAA